MSKIQILKGYVREGAPAPEQLQTATPEPPSEPEVGGRAANLVAVECPFDGALNHIEVDPARPRAFQCWKCNKVFYF